MPPPKELLHGINMLYMETLCKYVKTAFPVYSLSRNFWKLQYGWGWWRKTIFKSYSLNYCKVSICTVPSWFVECPLAGSSLSPVWGIIFNAEESLRGGSGHKAFTKGGSLEAIPGLRSHPSVPGMQQRTLDTKAPFWAFLCLHPLWCGLAMMQLVLSYPGSCM